MQTWQILSSRGLRGGRGGIFLTARGDVRGTKPEDECEVQYSKEMETVYDQIATKHARNMKEKAVGVL